MKIIKYLKLLFYNILLLMSKTFAISDLEGFYPDQVLPMYNSIKYDKLNEIIVCGDIIDSTIKSTPTIGILELKSHNIKTIFDIVVNSNIYLTFGNRDLNKIKVGPLTELCYYGQDENSRKLIDSFNSGDLDNLNITTFYNISNIKEKRWCQNMSNWYPFWGEKIMDNIDYWKDNDEPNKILKDGKLEKWEWRVDIDQVKKDLKKLGMGPSQVICKLLDLVFWGTIT